MLSRIILLTISLSFFSTANAEIYNDSYIFDIAGIVTSSDDDSIAKQGDNISAKQIMNRFFNISVNEDNNLATMGDLTAMGIYGLDVFNSSDPNENDVIIIHTDQQFLTKDFDYAGYFHSDITLQFESDFFNESLPEMLFIHDFTSQDDDTQIVLSILNGDIFNQAVDASGSFTKENEQTGEKFSFKYTVTDFEMTAPKPVPLPATAWLLISGIGGCCFFRRTKK